MNWEGFDRFHIGLKRPLLVVRGGKGTLACGYLNIASCNKTGEAAATVTGVDDFDDMLDKELVAISEGAQSMGVTAGMTGRDALEIFR